LGKLPLCNWSAVLQIRSFGTLKHTSAIRKGQNGRSWSAAEQLHSINKNQSVYHVISLFFNSNANGRNG